MARTTQSPKETDFQDEVYFQLELDRNDIQTYLRQTAHARSKMVSKEISVGDASTCRATLQLQMYPYYDEHSYEHKPSVHLKLLSCDRKKICIDFTLQVDDCCLENYSTHLNVGSHIGTMIDYGFLRFCYIIHCTGKYYSEKEVGERNNLTRDMGLLLEEHSHSDVTLITGTERLPAHKAILSARSPVFKAMFEHSYKESETGNVDIRDVEHEVLKQMLHYVYTGKQSEKMTDGMAERLLPAADKYGIEDLKIICEQHLEANLTVSTVVGFLVLADTHNSNRLKTAAQKFIRVNKSVVLKTKEWKEMFHSHVPLAYDTVNNISI